MANTKVGPNFLLGLSYQGALVTTMALQRERQTFFKKNKNFTRVSRVSLSSMHDYDVKMSNYTFYGGRKQATANFSLSF